MPITNLTNTSWCFNEELVSCGIGESSVHIGELVADWRIDINWYDVHFNQLYFELGGMANNVYFDTVDDDGATIPEQRFSAAQYEGGGWRYEAFRTITITGGPDVENSDLITWITSNAVQVEDPHPTHDTDKHCLVFSSPTDFTLEAIEEGSDHLGRDPEMGGVEPWTTNRGYWDGIMLYSTDGLHWSEWGEYGSSGASYGLPSVDGKLYLRGIGNTGFSSQEAPSDQNPLASCAYYWQLTGEQISCEGNIETLLDCGKVANGEHPEAVSECFIRLFGGWNDCPALISAPDILMETIPNMGCYHMFDGCTNLVKAPRIAATNIEYEALRGMFSGCTSLNQLPELLSTNIPGDAYSGMFSGCSSIKLSTEKTDEYKYEYRIPSTGTGTAEDGALDDMFVSTGGTFTGTPEINVTYYTSNEIVRAYSPDEPEDTPSGITISYNDTVIATVQPGETATLECAGMKMEGNIVVEAPEASGGGGVEIPLRTVTYAVGEGFNTVKFIYVTVEDGALIVKETEAAANSTGSITLISGTGCHVESTAVTDSLTGEESYPTFDINGRSTGLYVGSGGADFALQYVPTLDLEDHLEITTMGGAGEW